MNCSYRIFQLIFTSSKPINLVKNFAPSSLKKSYFYIPNKESLHSSCSLLNDIMSENSSSPSKIMKLEERLVWIDLEMTGLNVDKEAIMEIAVIVTGPDLEVVEEGPNLVVKVEDSILDSMNDWCKKHHGKSGLTESCRKSEISVAVAEEKVFQFVSQHTQPGKAPLAGNSVHADKIFLKKYMPKLMNHLHYRIVDVSTVKELCRRWFPEDFQKAPPKKLCHRALDDIKESIKELQYYKETIFKSSKTS